MKKLFFALLLILAAIDVLSAEFEIDQLRYTVISEKDHQVEVRGTTQFLSGDIKIPAEVTNNSTTYSVTSVGYYGFYNCGLITSVILPPTVEKIDYCAFCNCTALTSITLSESLREIGDIAFSDCTGLSSVVIPESVTTIGVGAFEGCSSLTDMSIPASVTEIGDYAFFLCDSMTEITADEGNQYFSSVDGVLYDKDRKELMFCPMGKRGELVLPESVEKVRDRACTYCSGLTSVIMPASVTSIGVSAFGGCTGLSSISIPPSVTCIGDYAFINCPLLTSVNIPGSLMEIGEHVFAECTALEDIRVDSDNRFFSSFDGVLMDKDMYIVICCPIGKKGDFTVPGSVILIGDNAFMECSLLSSVTLPVSVSDIGSEAFMGCTSLVKVVMPSVGWIGKSAFYGCAGLNEIVLPNSIKEIGYNAFSDCSGLTSVTIPESLKTLNNAVFHGCTGLTSVFLPKGLESMGHGTFANCTGLTSIRIPSTLRGLRGNPFSWCSNLTEISVDDDNGFFCSVDGVMFNKDITKLSIFPAGRGGEYIIPETVTEIGDDGFLSSQYLSVLHIPASVETIGFGAFWGASGLSEIYCAREKPAWTDGNVNPFNDQTYEEAVLYVPEGSLDAYHKNVVWGRFRDIREFVPSGISDVEEDVNSEVPVMIYDIGGVNVGSDMESLRPGMYIIRQGETTKKIMVK